jgi:hypothetical protein
MAGPLANKFTLTLFPHPPFEYTVQIVACPASTLEPDGLFELDSFITAKHVFIDGLVTSVKAGSVPPKVVLALQVKAIAALHASNVGLVVSVSAGPAPPKLALALQADTVAVVACAVTLAPVEEVSLPPPQDVRNKVATENNGINIFFFKSQSFHT